MMSKRKIAILAGMPGLLILSFFLVYRFLMPSTENKGSSKIFTVEYGSVASSVPATGIVNPESEVLLLSPASSIIQQINQAPGSHVKKGDVILTLDPKVILQDIESLKDQLGIMENDLQKNRLNARSIRVDLDYNAEVKNLRITSLKAEIADQEQLLKVGGISPALLEQTRQELVLAEKDLKTTREKNSIRLKQLEAEEQGLILQIDMRQKDLAEKMNLLNQLTIKAPSDGIILSLNGNEGEKVDRDKLLVKMSDLSTFKIKSTIENKYIDDLKIGGEVYAIIDNARLKGKIGSVSPVLTDKKIAFDVFLDNNDSRKLIPNLEVDLMIVTHKRDSVLRIDRHVACGKNKLQDVYVLREGKALKTKVTTGMIGTDFIEIQSGLNAGDQVITPDGSALHR